MSTKKSKVKKVEVEEVKVETVEPEKPRGEKILSSLTVGITETDKMFIRIQGEPTLIELLGLLDVASDLVKAKLGFRVETPKVE